MDHEAAWNDLKDSITIMMEEVRDTREKRAMNAVLQIMSEIEGNEAGDSETPDIVRK